MRYYILVKKKGSSRWMGVIPARKGVSLSKLKRTLRRSMKGAYVYKIITSAQLKSILRRMRPTRLKSRARRTRRVGRRVRRAARRSKRRRTRRVRRHIRRRLHRRLHRRIRRSRRARRHIRHRRHRRSRRRRKAWFE